MGRGEAKRSTPSSSFAPEEPPSKRTKLDHLPTSGHPGSAASPPQGSTRQTNDGRGTDVRGANLGPAGDDGVIVSELTGLEAGEDDGTAVTAEINGGFGLIVAKLAGEPVVAGDVLVLPIGSAEVTL